MSKYSCEVEARITGNLLYDFGFYLRYIKSKHQDIFEKEFGIAKTLGRLREFDSSFLAKLEEHLQKCGNCRAFIESRKEGLDRVAYICNSDTRFNYNSLFHILDYISTNDNRVKAEILGFLEQRFGEGFVGLIIAHIKSCSSCSGYVPNEELEKFSRNFIGDH